MVFLFVCSFCGLVSTSLGCPRETKGGRHFSARHLDIDTRYLTNKHLIHVDRQKRDLMFFSTWVMICMEFV
ncbi:hypothetical protein M758_1G204100 [Ceratodon purpureus]|uniref:Secreted protein n=1 Tax=Ceratodon purpureus TaxID=3225 RepID=A0A8T0JAL9_CERPU|nr:hypothetical protein KC19_1G216600 [Ceratodon purpureus]KAG0630793.1 hypothetical protein M758_1G204100 [Ceratodon purpureus]